MLASRVKETLSAAGHEVTVKPGPDDASFDGFELIVADLGEVDPVSVAGNGPPVLGFYSHVEVDTRRRAEAAGVDLVVPRSRLAREMPELAARLLESPRSGS